MSRVAYSPATSDREKLPAGQLGAASAVRRVLRLANRGLPRIFFLREACETLTELAGASAGEMWLAKAGSWVHCSFSGPSPGRSSFQRSGSPTEASLKLVTALEEVGSTAAMPGGSTGSLVHAGCHVCRNLGPGGTDELFVPLAVGDDRIGWLRLQRAAGPPFFFSEVEAIRSFIDTFTIVLVSQRAQAALGERVKEITCLYRLAQLADQPGIRLDELLHGIAELLPPGWQYPEVTAGRILLDDVSYASRDFADAAACQRAPIMVRGVARGAVEVYYLEEMPPIDEGPFLAEERHLIDTIAREVSMIVERRLAAMERERLEEQLRHADRLATIGQLAAGVAHELNEPLAGILGFSQLAQKCPGLPEQAHRDLEKITAAALHAREVIKKLMLFGRQTPPRKAAVDLGRIVDDGLVFLESRCAKRGIRLVRDFAANLPQITADASQLQQVLVNLVVNAIHAMPDGGQLTIRTDATDDRAMLVIEDTGIGMDSEIRQQAFLPFFTTKDVHEGTGLGLAVVHGIVVAHGGSIDVVSEPDKGSRFTVELPVGGPSGLDGVENV